MTVQEKLLREDPSLEKTIQFCKSVEFTKKNVKILSENNSANEVQEVRKQRMEKGKQKQVKLQNKKEEKNKIIN